MSTADPELLRLLVEELLRHLGILEGKPPLDVARRSVHALKGAAGLAQERDLSSALQRIERRVREGEEGAMEAAIVLVRGAAERLARGESALAIHWPEPPADLRGAKVDASFRVQYEAELRDHLASIDRLLAVQAPEVNDARALHRHIHTIKGAASSVGDEAMTWFCHGLEDRLGLGDAGPAAVERIVHEVAHWRATLGMMVEDAGAALDSLRSAGPIARTRSSSAPRRPSTHPGIEETATIRVSAASVDHLLDRFASVELVRERLVTRVEAAREQARELRRLRADLADALRLIGPPRPWGAPAAALRRVEWTATALTSLGEELDQAAQDLRGGDQLLKDSVSVARHELSSMRQTPLRRLMARLSTAIESEGRRLGRPVIVETHGTEETVDRRIGDLLVEPCLQLVRNAVAHGIEGPEVRIAAGKSASGTITISAKKTFGRLTIAVEDDGAGVDIARVRDRAVEIGAVTSALAEAADDNTLLALLFLPGFSTKETSDLLAGRGVGMDISLSVIQRLGGIIRLSSRRGQGFAARIELPVETGLASVLWVAAGGEQYALPASRTRSVRKVGLNDVRLPHLAACLGARIDEDSAFAVELDDDDVDKGALSIGVDEVGRTEDVLIRPMSPLIAGVGPFAGVIVRGDGSLRLAVDVYALAPRARTLRRLPEGRISERPSLMRPSWPPA